MTTIRRPLVVSEVDHFRAETLVDGAWISDDVLHANKRLLIEAVDPARAILDLAIRIEATDRLLEHHLF